MQRHNMTQHCRTAERGQSVKCSSQVEQCLLMLTVPLELRELKFKMYRWYDDIWCIPDSWFWMSKTVPARRGSPSLSGSIFAAGVIQGCGISRNLRRASRHADKALLLGRDWTRQDSWDSEGLWNSKLWKLHTYITLHCTTLDYIVFR